MKPIPLWRAQAWQKYYRIRSWFLYENAKFKLIIWWVFLFLAIAASLILSSDFQSLLKPYFSGTDSVATLKNFLLTLGGALIGAAAIAFSLIMFAMQVNVERMPHGLFRKFSSDKKLLGYFVITFIIAISLACLSFVPSKDNVALSIIGAFWGTFFLFIFLLVAYRRALNLISPTQQLMILLIDMKKNFVAWANAAKRTTPIINANSKQSMEDRDSKIGHDIERTTYFKLNPGWTNSAFSSISHCMSFSRRYAEQGDHETSEVALNTVVAINAEYIKAKGNTFYSDSYLINNPLSTDGFINETLEHLRQNVQLGITRGDEQQIEQTFRAFLNLCKLYTSIDYSSDYSIKTHAQIAAGYLSAAVESVAPHNMPDVLMEGVRLMGESALYILSKGEVDYITTISKNISMIACAGAVNEKYRPVTNTALYQLARLTFELIRSRTFDIRFAIEDIRKDVKRVADIFLKIPDSAFKNLHSTSMAPYYSGTSDDTLMGWLTILGDAVSKADAEDEDAKRIISHFVQWADKLYQVEKELLLSTINVRSSLAFDVIHWITSLTKILLALCHAPACSDQNRIELEKSTLFLISVLSWIPSEKEDVIFVENYHLTEKLFESAVDAIERNYFDIGVDIRNFLVTWAFKALAHETGLRVFEKACYGLVCLNLKLALDDSVLLKIIEEKSNSFGASSLSVRERASARIKEKAEEYHRDRYSLDSIEHAMTKLEHGALKKLLLGVSKSLVPELEGNSVDDTNNIDHETPDSH